MHRATLATASAVLMACLGACTNDRSDAASDADVAVQPTPTAEPTALDPFGWTDVSYQEYLDAANQLGLRPDFLVPEAGFSSGLNILCHTSAEDLVEMRTTQMSHTKETETYSTAKHLADEVALRLGLACPQRMTDWKAAEGEQAERNSDAEDGVSAVTDADLAEAIAEEAEAGSDPDHDPESDDESEAGEVSTGSAGGTATG